MDLEQATDVVGRLIDAYSDRVGYRHDVAREDPDDSGVPEDMHDGPVDDDGGVHWKVLPSVVGPHHMRQLEQRLRSTGVPLWLAAYAAARAHCFDQVQAQSHGRHQVLLPDTPTLDPLRELFRLLDGWSALLDAGLVPVAQWGDGYGPVCVDMGANPGATDGPVVWLDHEPLIHDLGLEGMSQRVRVMPLAQPLYPGMREFLTDIFPA